MTTFSIISLSILLFFCSAALSHELQQCKDHYSIKTTSEIVKRIVEKHAVEKRTIQNGVEWLNLLISNEEPVNVGGVSYYLNSNELDHEQTYYLDIHRFYAVPVYVADPKTIQEWTSSAPDNTKILSKIGRRCENRDDMLCGLECCPRRIKTIQKIMAASSNHHVYFRNVSYTSSREAIGGEVEKKICEFKLSKDDILKTGSIFYSCNSDEMCCTLSCCKPVTAIASPVTWQKNKSEIAAQFEKHQFLILSIVLFSAFVFITVCNQKLYKPLRVPFPSSVGTIRSEKSTDSDSSQKTVTTMILHDENEEITEATLLRTPREETVNFDHTVQNNNK